MLVVCGDFLLFSSVFSVKQEDHQLRMSWGGEVWDIPGEKNKIVQKSLKVKGVG